MKRIAAWLIGFAIGGVVTHATGSTPVNSFKTPATIESPLANHRDRVDRR